MTPYGDWYTAVIAFGVVCHRWHYRSRWNDAVVHRSSGPSKEKYISTLRPPTRISKADDNICPFCLDSLQDPLQLSCSPHHICCRECLSLMVENDQNTCPLCHTKLFCIVTTEPPIFTFISVWREILSLTCYLAVGELSCVPYFATKNAKLLDYAPSGIWRIPYVAGLGIPRPSGLLTIDLLAFYACMACAIVGVTHEATSVRARKLLGDDWWYELIPSGMDHTSRPHWSLLMMGYVAAGVVSIWAATSYGPWFIYGFSGSFILHEILSAKLGRAEEED